MTPQAISPLNDSDVAGLLIGLSLSLDDNPDIVVRGVYIWKVGRPRVGGDMAVEVVSQPILGCMGRVARSTLVEKSMASSGPPLLFKVLVPRASM